MELQQRHNLDLISTSATCAVGPQSRNSWQAGRTHTQEHQNGYHSTTTDVAGGPFFLVARCVLHAGTGQICLCLRFSFTAESLTPPAQLLCPLSHTSFSEVCLTLVCFQSFCITLIFFTIALQLLWHAKSCSLPPAPSQARGEQRLSIGPWVCPCTPHSY